MLKHFFLLLPFLPLSCNDYSECESRLMLPLGHTGYRQNVDISFDEIYIIFSSDDGSISLRDYKQQKLLKKITYAAGIPVKCRFIKGSHEFVSYCEGYVVGKDETDNTMIHLSF